MTLCGCVHALTQDSASDRLLPGKKKKKHEDEEEDEDDDIAHPLSGKPAPKTKQSGKHSSRPVSSSMAPQPGSYRVWCKEVRRRRSNAGSRFCF